MSEDVSTPPPAPVRMASEAFAEAKVTQEAEARNAADQVRPTKAQLDEGWWSEWVCEPEVVYGEPVSIEWINGEWKAVITGIDYGSGNSDTDATYIEVNYETPVTATRHRVAAPVPTRPEDIGAQPALTAEQLSNIAAVPNKAARAANPTAGHLASLDANGNPIDSAMPAANVATKTEVNQAIGAIPYNIGTAIVIDTASSEEVEGETVYYGAATLADRTGNRVSITAALDELRVTFPPAVSGKLRDFGLRVEVGTGSSALTAPALVPVEPTGETIKLENNAKQIPALADGTATAKGVTLLYFSETAPGVFVVKGEQVEEVA